MKRVRLARCGRQLLSPRTRICYQQPLSQLRAAPTRVGSQIRSKSTTIPAEARDGIIYEDGPPEEEEEEAGGTEVEENIPRRQQRPSAKLGALHARLALPDSIPLSTLARTLIDPSADPNVPENNASLGQIGASVVSYHVSEYLLCTYPRLPVAVLFAAAYAYNGPKTMHMIAKEWGVESADYPGLEVDNGLLQYTKMEPGAQIVLPTGDKSTRPDSLPFYRKGMTSRLVYDDEFGDLVAEKGTTLEPPTTEKAHANFVNAVVGAVYVHAGREAAKIFVKQHVLSRHLQMPSLFQFKNPLRELARLCKREDFEQPVARMLSETGRYSRSPVFVVGIYSGEEKLGEGAGASLPEARIRAAVASLKAWYLYSPGSNVRLPSDMEGTKAKPWEPVHIDIGEVIH